MSDFDLADEDYLQREIEKEYGMEIIPQENPHGLPHATLRPGQEETIAWGRALPSGQVGILQAPTGSGKTTLPAALSHYGKTAALVVTKSLQQANYGGSYKWDVLFGKGNYGCNHPSQDYGTTAEECLYTAKTMGECPIVQLGKCEYHDRLIAAKMSNRASLNYAYYLSARWPRINGYRNIVLDEAHLVSDVTLEWSSCQITTKHQSDWDLPPFPFINEKVPVKNSARVEIMLAWLLAALDVLPSPDERITSNTWRRRGIRLAQRLRAVALALEVTEEAWFLRADDSGIVIKPLTARYHFPRLFTGSWRTFLMSATIGDVATFAKELGIETIYNAHEVPGVWPADVRPVQALDAPRMSSKSTEADYKQQAKVIAEAIRDCPTDWGGIIHVTRKTEASLLARRLVSEGIPSRRLWIPREGSSTDQMTRDYQSQKQRIAGLLAVNWAWWEGVDLKDERICIVAKTPFPYLGDAYERERMAYDGKMFLQRTAWEMEQGLGRTRRGEPEDYDLNGERTQLVAIADGNWTRCKSYLSTNLVESIVT